MSINKRIKDLRKKQGMTQKDLAQKVNVSSQVISNWERNYTVPTFDDVSRLADALECTTDYLSGKSPAPNLTAVNSEDKKEVVADKIRKEFPDIDLMFNDLANMTAEELEDVYDYIRFKIKKKGK